MVRWAPHYPSPSTNIYKYAAKFISYKCPPPNPLIGLFRKVGFFKYNLHTIKFIHATIYIYLSDF